MSMRPRKKSTQLSLLEWGGAAVMLSVIPLVALLVHTLEGMQDHSLSREDGMNHAVIIVLGAVVLYATGFACRKWSRIIQGKIPDPAKDMGGGYKYW